MNGDTTDNGAGAVRYPFIHNHHIEISFGGCTGTENGKRLVI